MNGEIEDYDVDTLAEHIQSLYDAGEMQATQYDDLMRYIQNMCYPWNTGTCNITYLIEEYIQCPEDLMLVRIILKRLGEFETRANNKTENYIK